MGLLSSHTSALNLMLDPLIVGLSLKPHDRARLNPTRLKSVCGPILMPLLDGGQPSLELNGHIWRYAIALNGSTGRVVQGNVVDNKF